MKFLNKISLIIFVMIVLSVGCNQVETAQGVEGINAQGVQDLINKNKGKVVLVNFWATWCPPCRAEIPDLIELRKKFSDDELVMIGVSVDADRTAVDNFMGKGAKFNYPIYFADDDVGNYFRIQSIPRTIMYDPKGKRVFDKEGSYPGAMFENYTRKLLKDR
ncbi:TlpA family protein disulfide reductase [Maridesulfovibrio zosterae]|uniref:TlpA family protein disulfide reductase n=1 Tax=Maridesulfovibrio zosterae TaxID=82171 RepID=UPI000427489B|nr:TlpA disulfide reductase family protein [Maridesulfovibrio zosterae]